MAATEAVTAKHNIESWYQENINLFSPPVCNKLMFKEQLNVMFVGGPNTRTDFHLDMGSEFFFQMKGHMELITIQQNKRKAIKIEAGQVFLLPSRIPHSPQRPVDNSLGLVVERTREDTEKDGLRWYTDFNDCETVLYEEYFHCGDLGRDLVPVVKRYMNSEEAKTKKPGSHIVPPEERPVKINTDTSIPDPFSFESFLDANKEKLSRGETLPLFGDSHPDKEFTVNVIGGPCECVHEPRDMDVWLACYIDKFPKMVNLILKRVVVVSSVPITTSKSTGKKDRLVYS
eukprot:m.183398 g.183398  ORF g.183398 m.183398 type:complete len:287 (+) comp15543_c0_seq3:37-897(+)